MSKETETSRKTEHGNDFLADVGRSISVFSSAEDKRLDYRKYYTFHHFVSKRKALIEDIDTGILMEVHYSNFRFN